MRMPRKEEVLAFPSGERNPNKSLYSLSITTAYCLSRATMLPFKNRRTGTTGDGMSESLLRPLGNVAW